MKSLFRVCKIMFNSFISILALVGCRVGDIGFNGVEYTEQIEKNLSFGEVELVKFRNTNGSVKIKSWEKSEIFVSVTKKVKAISEEKAEEYAKEVVVRIERVGDTVEIVTEHPKGRKPSFIKSVSVSYDVMMPQQANLDIGSTNGSITVNEIIGEIIANTTNGSINITDCKGKFAVKTTNGKVSIEEAYGNINARTSNGKINAKLATINEESRFETSNGSINLQIKEGISVPLTAKTSNGSITVGLPSEFSADVEASTTNGRIYSELPITTTLEGKISKTSIHGKLNEGGSLMRLKTTNGKINIRKYSN